MKRCLKGELALLALALMGCDGSSVAVDAGSARPPADAAGPVADAGSPPVESDAGAADAGPPSGLDAGASGAGTLTGSVTRTAAPAAGGRGDLYIAVFTADPVTDRASAMNVAQLRLEDVDMSADGAAVPYTLAGVPPRAEPYFVTAFLDDNHTVMAADPASAGPDRGDLVALDGFASPRVTVATATTVPFDIVLSFNLPF